MWSRHGTELSHQFSDVAAAAVDLPDAVLDGELVAVLNVGSAAWPSTGCRTGSAAAARGAGPTSPSTSQLEYVRVPVRTRRP
ncbi:hypothetical protein ACFWA5_45675 [Streptomyces mirabilis]|uniref:hypothetical protein n=1 Tax=Streptomyces mirabilis TaxID=68239 RepID=UPI00365EE9F8